VLITRHGYFIVIRMPVVLLLSPGNGLAFFGIIRLSINKREQLIFQLPFYVITFA